MKQVPEGHKQLLHVIFWLRAGLLGWLMLFALLAVFVEQLLLEVWLPAALVMLLKFVLLVGLIWDKLQIWLWQYLRRKWKKYVLFIVAAAVVLVGIEYAAYTVFPSSYTARLLCIGVPVVVGELAAVYCAKQEILHSQA